MSRLSDAINAMRTLVVNGCPAPIKDCPECTEDANEAIRDLVIAARCEAVAEFLAPGDTLEITLPAGVAVVINTVQPDPRETAAAMVRAMMRRQTDQLMADEAGVLTSIRERLNPDEAARIRETFREQHSGGRVLAESYRGSFGKMEVEPAQHRPSAMVGPCPACKIIGHGDDNSDCAACDAHDAAMRRAA